VEAAREAYAASADIWSVLQESLTEQIRRLPASDAEVRIQAAEKARLAVNRTRHAYLNALRESYAAAAKPLPAPADGCGRFTTCASSQYPRHSRQTCPGEWLPSCLPGRVP